MEGAEKARELLAGVEEETLELIALDIESGVEFLGLAMREYAGGNGHAANVARAKAQAACDAAEQRMKHAGARGFAVTSIDRETLRMLKDRIETVGRNNP